MMRFVPVLLALAAGCVTVPSPMRGNGSDIETETAEERASRYEAHEAFMKLHSAWRDGDAAAAYALMSVQGMSDWMLTRTRDTGDADWTKLHAKMDAPLKVEFDAWVKNNKRVQIPIGNTRAEALPQSVLGSKWLFETWKHYFDLEKANLRQVALSMTVRSEEVAVEGTGMSVLVRINRAPTHIYTMVSEGGGWRFDYTVRPANKIK